MIKVEHIIREDFTMEGYEILELLLELTHERIRQVTNSQECPKDLEQAVCSLIWAADNVDISELLEIKSQLVKKYGSEFARKASLNKNGEVNERLCEKLTYKEPSGQLVLNYLTLIAEGYNVDWAPSERREYLIYLRFVLINEIALSDSERGGGATEGTASGAQRLVSGHGTGLGHCCGLYQHASRQRRPDCSGARGAAPVSTLPGRHCASPSRGARTCAAGHGQGHPRAQRS